MRRYPIKTSNEKKPLDYHNRNQKYGKRDGIQRSTRGEKEGKERFSFWPKKRGKLAASTNSPMDSREN